MDSAHADASTRPRTPPMADLPADGVHSMPGTIAARLGLWDAVGIIVGIVVGTAIFRTPMLVFQNVAGPWQALGVWLLGGILCIFGAFCYAELATAYPRNGGDYEYLSRAYGPPMGFFFGWAQLAVILPGSIGAMAYALADYGAELWGLPPAVHVLLAAGAVASLTLLNLLGVVVGKWLQGVLSAVKVLGLLGVVAAGIVWGSVEALPLGTENAVLLGPGLGLALVFVLYAFGGWNDAVFVAAEIHEVRRNLPRALIFGIAGITAIYLAVNAAYLAVLGFEAARQTPTPAAAVLQRAWGPAGGKAISLLVMISALGAINGMILAGSRVYATVGEDHRAFAWLSKWATQSTTPIAALIAQAAIALLLVLGVGTEPGRAAIDAAARAVRLPGLPWDQYGGGFDTLVAGSAPVFWGFFLATGVALLVLRKNDPQRQRPFVVPWYPLPPLIFCGTCLYMLYSSLSYARTLALLGLLPLALGAPFYLLGRRPASRPAA